MSCLPLADAAGRNMTRHGGSGQDAEGTRLSRTGCNGVTTAVPPGARGPLHVLVPGRQLLPPVRRVPAEDRSLRHDPARVQVRVRREVMPFDLVEVSRLAEGGHRIQITGVGP